MRKITLSLWLAALAMPGLAANADSHWERVSKTLERGDRKAADDALRALEQTSLLDGAWDRAARATAWRADLAAQASLAGPGMAADRLRAAAAEAPDPVKPVLEVMAAQRYRAEVERRRGGPDGADVQGAASPGDPDSCAVWNESRLVTETERCYQRALSFETVLKQIPVAMYGALFDAGTVPETLRPTLFDAIAYDLLDFYAWCWKEGLDDTESVTLEPDGPALQDVSGFTFLIPDEAARRSRVLRALRLWQVLLVFHESDDDPAAYADADLNRLQFCYPLVTGEKREERYIAALDRFAHKWRAHPLSSRALALRAQLAFEAGDVALARVVAQKGAAAHPASIGAAQCRNLIARIETPSLALKTERVWCAPWPQFEVSYKNLTQLHFRAVRVPFDEAFVPRDTQAPDAAEGGRWLTRKPLKQWSVVLPPAGGYRTRSHHMSVPQDLPAGLYALYVSPDAAFAAGGAPIQWALFRVSRLALVIDRKPDQVHGYVLSAREGEPVSGARVTVWRRQAEGGFKREQVMMSGEDGGFAVLGEHAGDIMILAERQGDAAQTWTPVWKGNARTRFEAPVTRATFMTDRNVYRPGQTLRYKGFFWMDDPVSRSVYAAAGSRVTVAGLDASGRHLAGQDATCTPFGSCSGEMVIPGDTPPGTFTLTAKGMGSTGIQIVAGDRSALDVELDSPVPGVRLGDVLTVNGRVARDGAAVPGARIAWRVARQPQGDAPCAAVPLTAGSAVSDAQGAFALTFFAKAPQQPGEEAVPESCVFTVTAEVSAAGGRSGRARLPVTMGEAAWHASLVTDAWQTSSRPVRFDVRVQAHGGTPVAVPGELQVLLLKPPEWVKRPDLPLADRADAGGCPGTGDDDALDAWEASRVLVGEHVRTGTNGAASGSVPLRAGAYRLVYETRDPTGRRVAARRNVRVLDPDARRLPFTVPVHVEAETWRVPAGEAFRAVWGSGYARASALVLAESDGLEWLRVRTDPEVTQQRFELPADAAARGGFWFRSLCVKENRAYACERWVEVVRRDQNLTVTVDGVPPTMRPGDRIACTVKVTDPDGAGCVAELLALLTTDDAADVPAWRGAGLGGQAGASTLHGGFQFQNHGVALALLCGGWRHQREPDAWRYRTWRACGMRLQNADAPSSPDRTAASVPQIHETGAAGTVSAPAEAAMRAPGLFLPHGVCDSDGTARFSFTVPDQPARWRLLIFAHDARLRDGRVEIPL